MKNNLSFRTPLYKELDYRKKLLADSLTMSYNLGYGDEENTGCIDFNESKWNSWYKRWVTNASKRFYAYIVKVDDNTPVGEVSLRYDDDYNAYCINIVIEAKYRGNGYSEQALRLLIQYAFEELGADKVYDDFPASRTVAEKLFKKIGFKRVSEEIVELTKVDYLKSNEKHLIF